MKPKSETKKVKNLENQLKKVQDQLSYRAGRKGKDDKRKSIPTTVPTLKGRIEKKIQTIKNQKTKK